MDSTILAFFLILGVTLLIVGLYMADKQKRTVADMPIKPTEPVPISIEQFTTNSAGTAAAAATATSNSTINEGLSSTAMTAEWQDALTTSANYSSSITGAEVQQCRMCDITLNKDIDKYVLKSSVPPCPDLRNYALKAEIGSCPDPSTYVMKSDIPPYPDMSQYVLKSQIQQCENCSELLSDQTPSYATLKAIYDNIENHPQYWRMVADCKNASYGLGRS